MLPLLFGLGGEKTFCLDMNLNGFTIEARAFLKIYKKRKKVNLCV